MTKNLSPMAGDLMRYWIRSKKCKTWGAQRRNLDLFDRTIEVAKVRAVKEFEEARKEYEAEHSPGWHGISPADARKRMKVKV